MYNGSNNSSGVLALYFHTQQHENTHLPIRSAPAASHVQSIGIQNESISHQSSRESTSSLASEHGFCRRRSNLSNRSASEGIGDGTPSSCSGSALAIKRTTGGNPSDHNGLLINGDYHGLTRVRIKEGTPASMTSNNSTGSVAAVKVKRKRSMIACRNCNERRVRCDGSITGLPCTTCKSAGRSDCKFIDSKRVRGKRGRFESRDKLAREQSEALANSLTKSPPGMSPGALMRNTTLTGSNIALSLFQAGGTGSSIHNRNTPGFPSSSSFHPVTSGSPQLQIRHHGRQHSGSVPGITNVNITASDNNIWRQLFDGATAGVPQSTRVTYVGESWHLSWVVHQKTGNSPLHFPSPVLEDSPETPPPAAARLYTLPTAAQKSRHADTGAANSNGSTPTYSNFEPDTSDFDTSEPVHLAMPAALQAIKDAFTIPPKPIRDALIESYFNSFHHYFPLLSKSRFLAHHNSSFSHKEPSLLLLQSVLMIGAIHCPLSLLTSPLITDNERDKAAWIPFPNRPTAIETFVSRARTLFNNDIEKDRLSVLQSMFLLQFWWRVPGDFKDQCFWLAGAIRVAQGMGLHRSTQQSWAKGILGDQERRIWRRIWWLLVIRDRQTAAAMGKPVLIHEEDCDVEEITMDDFQDECEETGVYMLESLKLAKILREILICEFTPATAAGARTEVLPSDRALRREKCQSLLEEWQCGLPDMFNPGSDKNVDNFGTPDRIRIRRVMGLLMHMALQGYELLLHRPIIYKPASAKTGEQQVPGNRRGSSGMPEPSEASPPEPTTTRQLTAPITSRGSKLITHYAREIIQLCHGEVRFIPLPAVSFIFGALSVQLVEMKSGDAERERKVKDGVDFNMCLLAGLAEMYPIAGWCRKLMRKILDAPEDKPEPAGQGPHNVDKASEGRVKPPAAENDQACPQPQSGPCREDVNQSQVGGIHEMETDHDDQVHVQESTYRSSGTVTISNEQESDQQHVQQNPHIEEVYAAGPSSSQQPSSAAYNLLHNSHPHYNPHHAFHNSYYSVLEQSVSPPADQNHGQGDNTASSSPGIQPPSGPIFSPFDLPTLEHSNRIRSIGVDDSSGSTIPSAGGHPSSHRMRNHSAALPGRSQASSSRRRSDAGTTRIEQKWARNNLHDTSLLRQTGPLDTVTISTVPTINSNPGGHLHRNYQHTNHHHQHQIQHHQEDDRRQRELGLDKLRYHVFQQQQQQALAQEQEMRLAEEVYDDDDIDNDPDAAGEFVEEDHEQVLHAAAIASRRGLGANTLPLGEQPHDHAQPATSQNYDESQQWVFDNSGVLIGNPFLTTTAQFNPVPSSVPTHVVHHGHSDGHPQRQDIVGITFNPYSSQ